MKPSNRIQNQYAISLAILVIAMGCDAKDLKTSEANQGARNSSGASTYPRLYVLDGGKTVVTDKSIFHSSYSKYESISLEVLSFLVIHPNGVLIWDTGNTDGEAVTMDKYIITPGPGIAKQLNAVGLSCDDVDFVCLSHYHLDHSGNANLFSGRATVMGQRDEYEQAFSSTAARTFGMKPETYHRLRNNPTELFIGNRDVFGDGTVQIIRAAGHTVGSQMLLVKLENYGPVLLSGDLYHFSEQRQFRRVPPFNVNAGETYETILKTEKYLKNNPNIELWITHDPQQMRSVKRSPQFYD